jgi:hypothetical protein
MRLHELIPVLRISVAQVILISGMGLLLLSLTNRFGWAVGNWGQMCPPIYINESGKRADAKERALVARLTKRTAEELTDYLRDAGMDVALTTTIQEPGARVVSADFAFFAASSACACFLPTAK